LFRLSKLNDDLKTRGTKFVMPLYTRSQRSGGIIKIYE